MLCLEHLSVEIDGRALLRDASTTFRPGVAHAVVGASGAGKSVLLKAATGLLPLRAGAVRLGALVATPGDVEAFARLRARVVFVHQDPALLDDLSLEENIAFAATRRLPRALARARVEDAIARLALDDVRARRPREVTPGVERRCALARALVLEPEVLIVDEPTTGVDPVTARDVDAALQALAARGATLVVVTHDRRSVAALDPMLHYVERGALSFTGDLDAARALGPPGLRALLFDATPTAATPSPETS